VALISERIKLERTLACLGLPSLFAIKMMGRGEYMKITLLSCIND
jgi:hypothetical protein